MDQYGFEKYLDNQPKVKGTEAIGRHVTNAFNMKEQVVLPNSYWRYVDWLKKDGVNVDAYIIDCDKERGDLTLSENLMEWLYFDMQERQEKNLTFPDFIQTV